MRKGTVTLGFLLLALTGCGQGVVSDLPEDLVSYKFDAKVAVNPTQPAANTRVSFNLEVTSSSNTSVKTDVVLRVVSAENETLYESTWNDVVFHEGEVWNLTQGFLPASDAGRKAWVVKLLVRNQATKEILYDQKIGILEFSKI